MDRGLKLFIAVTFAASLALALLAPLAAQSPDGLEKVAEEKGFAEKEVAPSASGIMAGYKIPALKNRATSTAAAGIIGVVTAFSIAGGIALIFRRKTNDGERKTS
jgi:hypothetical protein